MTEQNVMKTISVDKVTINIGCGTDAKKMERATALIEQITEITPVKTKTNRRISGWGLRPGLPVGVKITLRGQKAQDVLKRCLTAKDNAIKPNMFDNQGNMSFGIQESIDIPGVQYDPKIGIMGLQVTVTLKRPGFRIKTRRIQPARLPQQHRITKQQAMEFIKTTFGAHEAEESER